MSEARLDNQIVSTTLRIATQNLNWGGEPKAPSCDGEPRLVRLVPWLSNLNADILILTEYKVGPLGDELKDRLSAAGYHYTISLDQPPFKLGTVIASRRTVTTLALPIPAPTDPWRSVGARIDDIDVFGFYFPLEEAKETYWDWLLANAKQLIGRNVLLVGDFNTGKSGTDEAGEGFDCQDKHEALEMLGFVDTWRDTHPEGRDYTWYSSAGNGFRLDYIWASPQLAQSVQRVWHDHEARLTHSSDHSAVIAELCSSARVAPT